MQHSLPFLIGPSGCIFTPNLEITPAQGLGETSPKILGHESVDEGVDTAEEMVNFS